MRKHLLIIVTVAALLAITLIADRARLRPGRAGAAAAGAAVADLIDLQNKPLILEPYKGKVVLVNFWATWCEPCQIEIPWMIGFQEKYAPRGFTVLGISMDDEGQSVLEPYLRNTRFDVDGRKLAMNYPILFRSDGVAEQFGGLIGLPTSVVIGREGKVTKRIIGLASHDVLVKEIEAQLAKN